MKKTIIRCLSNWCALGRSNAPNHSIVEAEEDLLKVLFSHHTPIELEELPSLCHRLQIDSALLPQIIGSLCLRKDITCSPIKLTSQGKQRALQLIRRHRIYEKYLSEHSGYHPNEWHRRAHKMEHDLSAEEERRISTLLHNPLYDPHGDPIPTGEKYAMPQKQYIPSSQIEEGMWLSIQHLEDDDYTTYSRLNAYGLAQGCKLYVLGKGEDGGIHIRCEGEEYHLTPQEVDTLSLQEEQLSAEEQKQEEQLRRLVTLQEGETSSIIALSPSCRGAMRRRLMDLGFVRGSSISIDMKSPLGNPVAYVVRGTAIALRADQARYILVAPPVAV